MFLSSSPSSPPSKKSRLADDNTKEPSAAPSCIFPPNDDDIIATISNDAGNEDAPTKTIRTETAVSTPELLLLLLFDIVHQIPGLAIDIYSYLQPQDLCRLGMTGKVFAENVSSVRNKVIN